MVKKKTTPKKKKITRSAKTGKFVSKKYAEKHPSTTVTGSTGKTITMSAKGKK